MYAIVISDFFDPLTVSKSSSSPPLILISRVEYLSYQCQICERKVLQADQ